MEPTEPTKRSPIAAKRVTISGQQYNLRPWSPDDGDSWFFRLSQVALSAAIGASSNAKAAAMLAAWQGMPVAMFMELRNVCIEYTDLIGDADGKETILPLREHKGILRGQFADLLNLISEHVELMFAGPFSEIVALMKAATPPTEP